MNEELIRRFNEKVGPNDLTYHIGDFAMGSKHLIPEIRNKLNGRIEVILGNHDPSATHMLGCGFDAVHKSLKLEVDGYKLYLRHKPILKHGHWEDCQYHLCGHVHNEFARKENMINVGVDVSNFYPLTIEELIARDKDFPLTIDLVPDKYRHGE